MDTLLIESVDDVNRLISYLDGRIFGLRRRNDFATIMPIVSQFYREVILPWTDAQNLPSISEDTKMSEKDTANNILDFINLIDRL